MCIRCSRAGCAGAAIIYRDIAELSVLGQLSYRDIAVLGVLGQLSCV